MPKWILIAGGAVVGLIVVVVVLLAIVGRSTEDGIAAACEKRGQGNATQCACFAKVMTKKLSPEEIRILARFSRARRDKEARAALVKELGTAKLVGLVRKMSAAAKEGSTQFGIKLRRS